jgi:hypothetical protein
MRVDRLQTLMDLLKEDASDPNGIQFNIKIWANNPDETPRRDCGTQACALGLAAVSGRFPDLRLKKDYPSYQFMPIYNNQNGLKAAMELFDLKINEAEFIFSSWGYRERFSWGSAAEHEVIQRIQDLINNGLVNAVKAARRRDSIPDRIVNFILGLRFGSSL